MNKITPPHELADEVLDAATAAVPCLCYVCGRAPAELSDEALDAATAAGFSGWYKCGGPELSDEVLGAAPEARPCAYSRGPSRKPADPDDEALT